MYFFNLGRFQRMHKRQEITSNCLQSCKWSFNIMNLFLKNNLVSDIEVSNTSFRWISAPVYKVSKNIADSDSLVCSFPQLRIKECRSIVLFLITIVLQDSLSNFVAKNFVLLTFVTGFKAANEVSIPRVYSFRNFSSVNKVTDSI